MEISLRPLGFMEILQNNDHVVVNKIYTVWWLLFCKNSMKPRGRGVNSMALNI